MPKWQRVLACFQLIGGTACIIGALIPDAVTSTGAHFTIPLFTFFAGGIAAIAGFLLAVKEEMGLWLSFAVQTAQVLSFNIGAQYVFLAGPKVQWVVSSVGTGIYVGGGGLGSATISPGDGSLASVGLAVDANTGFLLHPLASASWVVAVNFAALYFALKLWYAIASTEPVPTHSAPVA